jgi:dimethylhistidine N-methyltransferase
MPYPVRLQDYHPATADLREEVLAGLQKTNKELPCKLFYDDRGSRLFDKICELPEYYLTRTELQIMHDHGAAMAELSGPKAAVIEYGSGSSEKTGLLLDELNDPVAYVPIDISREHLLDSASRIASAYPSVEVLPVCADYEQPFQIPEPVRTPRSRLVYFPGSTIGNFHPARAARFLCRIAQRAGHGGRLLIGVDLKKDPEILNRAYNDDDGVTADFNLNLLKRINRDLGTRFVPENFQHHAYYNEAAGRIEMHLRSRRHQTVKVDDVEIEFEPNESIWTESSYKYSVDDFARLAGQAGFELETFWSDDEDLFSVQMYIVSDTQSN